MHYFSNKLIYLLTYTEIVSKLTLKNKEE